MNVWKNAEVSASRYVENRFYVGKLAEDVAASSLSRGVEGGLIVYMPKRSARQEYRLKQREQIETSPLMATKFPDLKALRVTLAYYDATGTTKNGEMKCKLNVEYARSTLLFACPGGECFGGDFDLSEALASAVAGRRRVMTGELRCQGTRKRSDRERVPCQTLLRYRLHLRYD